MKKLGLYWREQLFPSNPGWSRERDGSFSFQVITAPFIKNAKRLVFPLKLFLYGNMERIKNESELWGKMKPVRDVAVLLLIRTPNRNFALIEQEMASTLVCVPLEIPSSSNSRKIVNAWNTSIQLVEKEADIRYRQATFHYSGVRSDKQTRADDGPHKTTLRSEINVAIKVLRGIVHSWRTGPKLQTFFRKILFYLKKYPTTTQRGWYKPRKTQYSNMESSWHY